MIFLWKGRLVLRNLLHHRNINQLCLLTSQHSSLWFLTHPRGRQPRARLIVDPTGSIASDVAARRRGQSIPLSSTSAEPQREESPDPLVSSVVEHAIAYSSKIPIPSTYNEALNS